MGEVSPCGFVLDEEKWFLRSERLLSLPGWALIQVHRSTGWESSSILFKLGSILQHPLGFSGAE